MSKKYILQSEDSFGFVERSRHVTLDDAEKAIGELFDSGDQGDFKIVDEESGYRMRYRGYRFVKNNCPVCGKEVRVREMERTRDCHGIPYRMVCSECYDKIMYSRGYDGEKYTERDECIYEDY